MNEESLLRLLRTAKTTEEIDVHREEIAILIPKVSIMFNYDQQNHAHQYDLWMHSLHTVTGLPKGINDDMLYLAALLHDIGKPDCRCRGNDPEDTSFHYYGHPAHSREIVYREIMPCLHLSLDDGWRLLYYVEHHDDDENSGIDFLKEYISKTPPWIFRNLMLLQSADASAHRAEPWVVQRIEVCNRWADATYLKEMCMKLEVGTY